MAGVSQMGLSQKWLQQHHHGIEQIPLLRHSNKDSSSWAMHRAAPLLL